MMPNENSFHKKQEIISRYNSTSHFYDRRYREIQEHKLSAFLTNLPTNLKLILDAGCGTGLLAARFLDLMKASIVKSFNYVGIDISLNMLKLAKNLFNKVEKNGKNALILGDLENLPLRTGKFHSIFSITSLQNLYDITKGITEMHRVSKVNANLYISILKKGLDRENFLSNLKQ
jgi:ubiquinone/menaquinone biosynthesis C-methylase UbiE